MPPWYEMAEWLCVAVLALAPALRLWPLLDARSRPAAGLRRLWRRPGADILLLAVVGLCGAVVVTEDVLDGGPEEIFPALDRSVRAAVAAVSSGPVRQVAATLSDLTGVGLATAVVAAALALAASGRRRDGVALCLASLSAWALSIGLKQVFGVPRPHSSAFGFPSGHALVTVVACGFLAWSLTRSAPPLARRAAYQAAAVVAVLAAASRVLLGAHWLSDVVAGLCLGLAWLGLSILIARRSLRAGDGIAVR